MEKKDPFSEKEGTSQKEVMAAEKIHSSIDEILTVFSSEKDVDLVLEELLKIKRREGLSGRGFEEAWTKERINQLVSLLDDENLNLELVCPNCLSHFQELVCLGVALKTEKEGNELNNRVLKTIESRLAEPKKRGMSDFMLEISGWIEPAMFTYDNISTQQLQQFILDVEDILARKWDYVFEQNKDNLSKVLKIARGSGYVAASHREAKSEERSKVGLLLDKMKKYDRYFIKIGMEKLLGKTPFAYASAPEKKEILISYYPVKYIDLSGENVEAEFETAIQNDQGFRFHVDSLEKIERKTKYDEADLRNEYYILPTLQTVASSCYSRISQRYGVIYNAGGQIDSFFSLEKQEGPDVTFPERLSLADVLEREGFNRESLTKKEYNQLISNYKILAELPMREVIEKEFDIRLSDFNVREQVQFLNFLSSKTVAEVEDVKNFFDQSINDEDRTNRVRTFLTLEIDENNGDKIIEIGNSNVLSPEEAKDFFEGITEIYNKVEENINDLFDRDRVNLDIEKIRKELLKKANQFIIDFSKRGEENKGLLLQGIRNTRIKTILLKTALKTLKMMKVRERESIYEYIKGLDSMVVDINEWTEEKKKDFSEEGKFGKGIMSMASQIYQENIFKDNSEAAERVLGDIRNRINNIEKYRVYLQTLADDVEALITVKPIEGKSEEVILESFIVHPELRRYLLWVDFAEDVLKIESANYSIRGKVRKDNKAFIAGLEEMGAVFDRKHPVTEKDGVTYYNMYLEKGSLRERLKKSH